MQKSDATPGASKTRSMVQVVRGLGLSHFR